MGDGVDNIYIYNGGDGDGQKKTTMMLLMMIVAYVNNGVRVMMNEG